MLNLDLNVGVSHIPEFHQPAGLLEDKSRRALMFLFRPFNNQFRNVALRPYSYSFDENLLAKTAKIAELSRGMTANAGMMMTELDLRHNLASNLMPSNTAPITLHASALSDRWRFILILTENGTPLGENTQFATGSASSALRRIYTGYFEGGEPLNPKSFSTNHKAFNPNAYMVITHKTKMGSTVDFTPFGRVESIKVPQSDSYFHGALAKGIMTHHDGNRFGQVVHNMTPDNCINSIEMADDGTHFENVSLSTEVQSDKDATRIPGFIEHTSANVKHVVTGLLQHQMTTKHRRNLSYFNNDSWYDQTGGDIGYDRLALGHHLGIGEEARTSDLDLDINRPMSLATLDAMVGGQLDIDCQGINRPQMYETVDQQEASHINRYSFLITSTVIPIITSLGLNEFSFRYGIENQFGQPVDRFDILGAAAMWPIPEQKRIELAEAAKHEITRTVLRTIYESMGDFRISVRANATGMTVVRLDLMAQGKMAKADFEMPSVLGGMVSPIIGDLPTMHNNAAELNRLNDHMQPDPNVQQELQNFRGSFGDFGSGTNFRNGIILD